MSRPARYEPSVFASLAGRNRARRSNREIARVLNVSEATVRRGLALYEEELLEAKRERDRKYLLTDKGRARARRFRLREQLKRMNNRRNA